MVNGYHDLSFCQLTLPRIRDNSPQFKTKPLYQLVVPEQVYRSGRVEMIQPDGGGLKLTFHW